MPAAGDGESLRGRHVWLVHPWALRPPPQDLPEGSVVVGVFLREHHQAWPWPEARWRWVHAAMAGVTSTCWWASAEELQRVLHGAASVRSLSDPHLQAWLPRVALCEAAPTLFPPVERPCSSFSQWWTRATRGLRQAHELLRHI